jgi:transposase
MVFSGGAWSKRFEAWLSKLAFEVALDRDTFLELRAEVQHHQGRLARLDSRVEELSRTSVYAERVQRMRCFRGLDTLTAMGVVTALHNAERFRRPEEMMSYVGLTPSESSSGRRERRGAITRQGDRLLRRLLVEAANNQASKPRHSPALAARRKGQPPEVVAVAEKAALRLHRRFWRLKLAGRPHNVVVVAIARELVGFLWAMFHLETASRQAIPGTHR